MDILFTKELIKCTTGLDVNIIRPEGSELLALLGPSIKEVIFAAKSETMIKQMLSSMEYAPGKRFLDPCCGSGSFLLALSEILSGKFSTHSRFHSFSEHCPYSLLFSICIPISFPYCVSLFSTSASLFLPCKYVHQYHFSRLQADSLLPEPPGKPIYMH